MAARGVEGVHFSSIVNEFIKTISSLLTFLRKILKQKKPCKINHSPPVRSFCAQKIVAFVALHLLNFVYLVGFTHFLFFCVTKIFLKKQLKFKLS